MLTNERKLLICGVVKIVTELLFVVLLGGDNKHSHQSSMGFCFEIILFSPDYQNTKLITSGDSLYGVPSLVESRNE